MLHAVQSAAFHLYNASINDDLVRNSHGPKGKRKLAEKSQQSIEQIKVRQHVIFSGLNIGLTNKAKL